MTKTPNLVRFPILSILSAHLAKYPPAEPTPIQYIEIDLVCLATNHRYINDLIGDKKDILTYELCLDISKWLLKKYEEIRHPILSPRILNACTQILHISNNLREY